MTGPTERDEVPAAVVEVVVVAVIATRPRSPVVRFIGSPPAAAICGIDHRFPVPVANSGYGKATRTRARLAAERVAKERTMNTANQRTLTRGATPVARLPLAQADPLKFAPAEPELNRQERVIFTAYLLMIGVIVAVMAVAGLLAG